MSHPHLLDGFLALILAMEHGLGEVQGFGDWLIMLGTGLMSWHNQITLVTSLLWDSVWGLASALNLVSEMLSNEPGSVSYCKLVRLDVLADVRAWIDKVWPRAEPRKMGHWSYPIPEGGKRMSIKVPKTAPAKTCIFHTDWKKWCIFQEEKNEDPTQRPTNSPEYHYGCYTMIATNMQYFSSMPSGYFVLDHTKLDKCRRSTEEEQCTSTQVTGCSSL